MRTSEVIVVSVAGKRLSFDELQGALLGLGVSAERDGPISITDALLGLIERPGRHVLLGFSEE